MGWLKRLTQSSYHERLSEYVDGRLGAEETAKLEAQLAASDQARTEVSELRAVAGFLRRTPMVDAPRSFALPYAPSPVANAPRRHRQGLRALSMATSAAVLALVLVTSADIAGLVDGAPDAPATSAVERAAAPESTDGSMDTAEEEAGMSLTSQAPTMESATAEAQPPAIQHAPPVSDTDTGQEGQVVDWLKLSLSILAGALGLATLVLFWMPERPTA